MRQTGLDSKIALVPGVEVRRYATSRGVRAEMSSKHQGPNFLEIENWAFELLVKADGTKTIRQLMAGCQAPLPLEREIVEWLRAIDDLKYIMRVE